MIVSQPTPEAILNGLKALFESASGARLADRQKSWKLYKGVKSALESDVKQYFPEDFLRDAQLPICIQNPAKKIVNSRFISYRVAPQRTVDDGLAEREHGLDSAMRQLELSVGLLGTDALFFRYDPDDDRFNYFVLRKFEPLFLPGDLEPFGCAFPLYDESAKKDSECKWAIWTDVLSFYISPNGAGIEVNEDGTYDNPYGVLPVLFAHRESEAGSWWRPELADVLNAQSWHNWCMTIAGHAGLLQGLGVPWINSPPPPSGTSTKFGPYEVQYTDGGGMGFATSSIDLEKLPALAKEYLNSVAFSHHLHMNWSGDSMATSGEHQRLLEADLSIAVQTDNVRWGEFERLRVKTEAAMLNAVSVASVSDEVTVNYRESHLPMSEREIFELWKMRRSEGVATVRDYFKMQDPDISDEALEKRLAELQADPVRPVNGGRVNPLTAALGA